MTKKHYKIQSRKGYWFETLSLFTDECLTKEEMEEYKHELAQRLADLVKNNCVLDDVNKRGDIYIATDKNGKKTAYDYDGYSIMYRDETALNYDWEIVEMNVC